MPRDKEVLGLENEIFGKKDNINDEKVLLKPEDY